MASQYSKKSSTLELARKGDPNAIAAIFNNKLHPKGIHMIVKVKNGAAHILLESDEVPCKEKTVPFIQKGMASLSISTIDSVKVYGRKKGIQSSEWDSYFDLKSDLVERKSSEPNIPVSEELAEIKLERESAKQEQVVAKVNLVKRLLLNPIGICALITLLVVPVLAIVFSSYSSNPEKTVNYYLKDLSNADEQSAISRWCFQDGGLLIAVRDWEIIRTEKNKIQLEVTDYLEYIPEVESQLKRLNALAYTDVIARVNSSNRGGMQITTDFKFKIWPTQKIPGSIPLTKDILKAITTKQVENNMLQNTSFQSSEYNMEDLLEQRVEIDRLREDFAAQLSGITEVEDGKETQRITTKSFCIISMDEN